MSVTQQQQQHSRKNDEQAVAAAAKAWLAGRQQSAHKQLMVLNRKQPRTGRLIGACQQTAYNQQHLLLAAGS
jgi:hypothetical protein